MNQWLMIWMIKIDGTILIYDKLMVHYSYDHVYHKQND